MDARGVQRTLEKIRGMAESAETVGQKSAETIQHDSRISEPAKQVLLPLYREHALRIMGLYADLGSAICTVIRDEAEDDTARGLIDLFHASFSAMSDRSREKLQREIGVDAKLDKAER